MLEGVTGLKVSGRDPDELRDAMARLMDADLRRRLGRQARVFAESRRVDEPFTAIFDADAYRRRLKGLPDLAPDANDGLPVALDSAPPYSSDGRSFDEAKSVA
jgi:hypothetical protein